MCETKSSGGWPTKSSGGWPLAQTAMKHKYVHRNSFAADRIKRSKSHLWVSLSIVVLIFAYECGRSEGSASLTLVKCADSGTVSYQKLRHASCDGLCTAAATGRQYFNNEVVYSTATRSHKAEAVIEAVNNLCKASGKDGRPARR